MYKVSIYLEVNGRTLGLLLTTKLEVLASLEGLLVLVPTLGALESQHNFLCGLGLWSVLVGVGIVTCNLNVKSKGSKDLIVRQ
jgi:cation transporter-like permease